MARTRRTLLAGVMTLALFTGACAVGTGSSDENGEDGASGEDGANGAADGGEFTFASWGGGYQDAQEEIIVQPWAEENGLELFSDGPTDYSRLRAQVEADSVEWDVVTLEPFWAIAHCGTLLEEIADEVDTTNLPEEAVSDCGIPFDVLSYVLVYDTEAFGDNPPTSWADFFDTETYPGNRGVWNYAPGGALEAAMLADGVDIDDLYPLDVDRALDKLDEIRGDIAFYDTGAQQVQQLESQEVSMSIAWSGRALDAVRNDAPYEPVWDGHLMLVDSFAIPMGSQNVEAGIDLINYATSPEAQNAFIETYTYGPVNSEADPDLDEVAEGFLPTLEGRYELGRYLDQDWWAENFDRVSEQWTQWAAG